MNILLHFLSQSSLVFLIKNVDSQWVKNLLEVVPITQLFLVTPLAEIFFDCMQEITLSGRDVTIPILPIPIPFGIGISGYCY